MAEFSKEYEDLHNKGFGIDFSFENEFRKLKDGYTLNLVCEGFGTKLIYKQNNLNFVMLMNGEEFLWSDFIKKQRRIVR